MCVKSFIRVTEHRRQTDTLRSSGDFRSHTHFCSCSKTQEPPSCLLSKSSLSRNILLSLLVIQTFSKYEHINNKVCTEAKKKLYFCPAPPLKYWIVGNALKCVSRLSYCGSLSKIYVYLLFTIYLSKHDSKEMEKKTKSRLNSCYILVWTAALMNTTSCATENLWEAPCSEQKSHTMTPWSPATSSWEKRLCCSQSKSSYVLKTQIPLLLPSWKSSTDRTTMNPLLHLSHRCVKRNVTRWPSETWLRKSACLHPAWRQWSWCCSH